MAVGSHTQASADAFAATAGIERAFGRPDELVSDPDVDVVYVATPHHLHRSGALRAIEAGTHVLVEKPSGLDAVEAQKISELRWLPESSARRRCGHSSCRASTSCARCGLLGDVCTVLADHGEHFDPPHRILDPAMAGGSLLELGTYVTTLATWVLGPAARVQASGSMTPTGVNGQAAMVLTHVGDATSVLHSTLLTRTPTSATIAGTAATLTLPGPFFVPATSSSPRRTGHAP